MGREILCRAKSGGKWVAGKALLETTEVIFRGDLRLKIPFAALESVVARNGELHLKWSGQSAVFELGAQAEKWAHTILHPKSTAEKLGIKPGLTISALNLSGDATMKDAHKLAVAFSDTKPLKDSDVIFFGATTASELERHQETPAIACGERLALDRLPERPQRNHRASGAGCRPRGRIVRHEGRKLLCHPYGAEICPPEKQTLTPHSAVKPNTKGPPRSQTETRWALHTSQMQKRPYAFLVRTSTSRRRAALPRSARR